MKRPLIAGNWKMHGTAESLRSLARSVGEGAGRLAEKGCDVAVFPPFPYLRVVAEVLRGSGVRVGAQNMHWEEKGAFTGDVSPAMLVDVSCDLVLVGHSERRHVFGESDEWIRRKLEAALTFGLTPVLCIGETESERESGQTEAVLARQLDRALAGLALQGRSLEIAYEPVWAIGTGKTATPAMAAEAHRAVRAIAARTQGAQWAEAARVLYGGSVKASNAADLLSSEGVDGVLVGGASLVADEFLAIGAAARLR